MNLHTATAEPDSVQSLICFVCSCSYPDVKCMQNDSIDYESAYPSPQSFWGLRRDQSETSFGLDHYLTLYGDRQDGKSTTKLTEEPYELESDEWQATVHLRNGVLRLLCVVRKTSSVLVTNIAKRNYVQTAVFQLQNRHKELSTETASESGDQRSMVGLCGGVDLREARHLVAMCSPCVLGSICFSLESDYAPEEEADAESANGRKTRNSRRDMFQQLVYSQGVRTVVRGNATWFEIPLNVFSQDAGARSTRFCAITSLGSGIDQLREDPIQVPR